MARILTKLKWDLGEFDQKGAVRTRWGTKEELLKACAVAKANGVNVIVDAILNVSMIISSYLGSEKLLFIA